MKTTRPVAAIRTIDDIIAIERQPYDDLVTAHSVYDLLLATARHAGDRQAITVLRSADPDDVGISLTHAEMLGDVTRAANMFHRLGLRPAEGVAAFLTPTLPELPTLLLGAQVAGVASSLNYLLTRDAVFDLLNAEQATILVIPSRDLDEMCWSKAEGAFDHVPSLRHVLVIGGGGDLPSGFTRLDDMRRGSDGDALDFAPVRDRDAVCALFHTGGTTGRPKLVRLTHGNQIHAAFGFAQVFGYNERDVVINGFPFFHVGGTMTVGLSVLAAGGHIIIPSPYGLRSPSVVEHYWRLVERFGVTVVGGVPTSIAAITNSWKPGTDVSSVRMAVTGGAVLPKAVGARFEMTTGIRIYETYGMTETAAAIAFNPGMGEPLAGSVGFRAPFSETRIVKFEAADLVLCHANETGLVQVKGPQVFPGYVDPAHNRGTLDADGWLTTGDVGYLTEDARLVLTGREKDLIIRGGHNIDPATIEDVANQFPGVQISAAVGMPDEYAGEVPALFVVASPGAAVDMDALRAHLDRAVHEPPARPRVVLVIDALPVTAVGKIYKPALRDLAIKEKVRMEVARHCGAGALATVDIGVDAQKRTVVTVEVTGSTPAGVGALVASLKPLAQTYDVRSAAKQTGGEPVLLDYADGIAVLTLNRPDSLNAFSRELAVSMERQLTTVAALPGLRAVIVTGAGRAFCAGGDLVEFEEALRAGGTTLIDVLRYNQDVLQMVEDLPVPVIAAANGAAVAGGLELLLCCDIVLAAEGTKMGDGHARYGIVPAGGATVRLMEKVSPAHAAHLFYTASLIDAETLANWGLVNEVVPRSRLMDRAREIASEIAERSPSAVRHIKALTRKTAEAEVSRHDRLRAELEHFRAHLESLDLAEGLAAFREKRVPRFQAPS